MNMNKLCFITAIFFLSFFSLNVVGQSIITIAGTGYPVTWGDGRVATEAGFSQLWGVAVDNSGNVYIADGNVVRKIDHATGIIGTFAGGGSCSGTYCGDGGPATAAKLNGCTALALDNAGNLYIADVGNFAVRKVDAVGIITTVAGNGTCGYTGDNGAATAAQLNYPAGLYAAATGELYIADGGVVSVLRKVSASGIITTIAGTGAYGFSGDGGAATAAQLSFPQGVTMDTAGNAFIADVANGAIRRIDKGGIITTYAGNGAGSKDGIPATAMALSEPTDVVTDTFGNLFITDKFNDKVRKVNAVGIITTVAGSGAHGSGGDKGPATAASFMGVYGIAKDNAGNLYVTDIGAHVVREIIPTMAPILETPVLTEKDGISVFPNPGKGIFNITVSAPLDEDVVIEVTDIAGKVVARVHGTTNNAIYLQERAPAGIYILSAGTSHGNYRTKLILE
ncbi:MAG: hypothetical protein JWQ38_373 [Flavipsychrobacter sp.]|nr:hypothetical protein [Flavipsychrobacter sp.]